MEPLSSPESVLATFFQQVATDTNAWWYGVSIPPEDPNRICTLLGLSQDHTMLLLNVVGWVCKHGNVWAIQLDGVVSFIKRFVVLTEIMEATKTGYYKKANCLFVRIGNFPSSVLPFGPTSIVSGGRVKPHIQHIEMIRNTLLLHPSIRSIATNTSILTALQQSKRALSFSCQVCKDDNKSSDDEIVAKSDHRDTTITTLASNFCHEKESKVVIPEVKKAHRQQEIYSSPSSDKEANCGDSLNRNVFDNRIGENSLILTFLLDKILPHISKTSNSLSAMPEDCFLNPCLWNHDVGSLVTELSRLILHERDKKMSKRMGSESMTPNETIHVPTLMKYGVDDCLQ